MFCGVLHQAIVQALMLAIKLFTLHPEVPLFFSFTVNYSCHVLAVAWLPLTQRSHSVIVIQINVSITV